MKKLYLIALILTCLTGALLAQPTFEIDNTTGDPGGVVSVNFKVKDFSRIVGMQFSINWDPTVLAFNSVKNISEGIRDFDAGAFNTDSKWTDDGNVIVQWYDGGIEANFLADGSTVFTIDFDIVGGAGSSTNVEISGTPRAIEIINDNESNIGLKSEGGLFTASGNGGAGTFRLIGSEEMGATGENVCVEVSAQGFTNIAGMQLSMNWDPSFLKYTGVGAFNVNGFSQATFAEDDVSNGKIVLSWTDPASAGITLASGTRIFEICFEIIGTSGSSSVQFTNDPLEIEISNNDDERLIFSKKDGTVTVDGGGGGGGSDCTAEGFALSASEENTDAGSNVCVNVGVKGFSKVTTLATTMEWDYTILCNRQIQNINLGDLSAGRFNLDQGSTGKLGLLWLDETTDGLTIPDGQIIFDVCFDVIGSNGQTSNVTFTDGILEREVTVESQAVTFNQCDGKVTVGNANTSISVSTDQPTCKGGNDGSIDITVNTGTSPYTYAWTKNGAAAGTTQDLSGVSAGTYVVNVTDASGAQFSQEVILGDPAGVTINDATVVNPTGAGNDGSIALSVSGGSTPLSFLWSNGETTRDIAGLIGGAYTVTITESTGCEIEATYTLGGGELAVTIDLDEAISCNGESDGQLIARPSGGAAPYSYQWSQGGETGNNPSGLTAGKYSVTVTDGTGATASGEITLEEPAELQVGVTTTPSPSGMEGTANAQVSGGTAPYTYRWSNNQTTRLIINLAQGSYNVLVTDANGCQDTGTGQVREGSKECFSAVPVMSPNGDQMNDFFDLACVGGTDNELEIYNRQGELVYEATNYNNDWTGIDKNGEQLPDGAYFWVIRVRQNGVLEQHLGHLTILATLN